VPRQTTGADGESIDKTGRELNLTTALVSVFLTPNQPLFRTFTRQTPLNAAPKRSETRLAEQH
jgi:hypothetical protein